LLGLAKGFFDGILDGFSYSVLLSFFNGFLLGIAADFINGS
jgi:hypothetical protein